MIKVWMIKPPAASGTPWSSPTMTGDSAPSPYVVSVSSKTSGDYYAYRAMDSQPTTTAWASASGAGRDGVDWWKIYCGGKNVKVTHLHIYNVWNAGFHTFKLQGSNDNAAWTDVYEGHANNDVDNEYTFTNDVSYKYYRILRLTGYYSTQTCVGNISMSGTEV